MLARKFLLPAVEIARLLGVLVFLPRVAMLTARPPVTSAIIGRVRRRFSRRVVPRLGARCLGRCPQLAAGEPLHLGIRMLLPQPPEGGLELLSLSGAKCGRQPACQN